MGVVLHLETLWASPYGFSSYVALREKVDRARDALFDRAGVPTDGSWLPRPYEAPESSEF